MSLSEELLLLVKSEYPVVFCETVDEERASRQLLKVAGELGLSVHQWAITSGLSCPNVFSLSGIEPASYGTPPNGDGGQLCLQHCFPLCY